MDYYSNSDNNSNHQELPNPPRTTTNSRTRPFLSAPEEDSPRSYGRYPSQQGRRPSYSQEKQELTSPSCLPLHILHNMRQPQTKNKKTPRAEDKDDGLPLMTRISPTSSSSSCDQQDAFATNFPSSRDFYQSRGNKIVQVGIHQSTVPLYHPPEATHIPTNEPSPGSPFFCPNPGQMIPGRKSVATTSSNSYNVSSTAYMVTDIDTKLRHDKAIMRACNLSDVGSSILDDSTYTEGHDDITIPHRNHTDTTADVQDSRHHYPQNQRSHPRQSKLFTPSCLPLPTVKERSAPGSAGSSQRKQQSCPPGRIKSKEQPSIWRRVGATIARPNKTKSNSSSSRSNQLRLSHSKNSHMSNRRDTDAGSARLTTDMLKQHEEKIGRVASPINCYEGDALARDVIHKKDHFEHCVKKGHIHKQQVDADYHNKESSAQGATNILPKVQQRLKNIIPKKSSKKEKKDTEISQNGNIVQWERPSSIFPQKESLKVTSKRRNDPRHQNGYLIDDDVNEWQQHHQQAMYMKWQHRKQELIDQERSKQMRLVELQRQRQLQMQEHQHPGHQQSKRNHPRTPPRTQVSF